MRPGYEQVMEGVERRQEFGATYCVHSVKKELVLGGGGEDQDDEWS